METEIKNPTPLYCPECDSTNIVDAITSMFCKDCGTWVNFGVRQPDEQEKHKIREIPKSHCGICGGHMAAIRGRNPTDLDRFICPTCVYERLEQINEISSPYYGKAEKQQLPSSPDRP